MTTAQKCAEAVRLMRSREKKNGYTQGTDREYFFGKPEGTNPGYSDCSSSVRLAIKRAAGISIGSNTSAQVDNARKGIGVIIERPTGIYFDESKLKPGDALYWKGNKAHTEQVGHVELYTGPNECYGHGSGMGPSRHNLKSYCAGRTGDKKALMAVRWIKDDGTTATPPKLGDKPLVKGVRGEDVKEMQALLLRLGENLPKYGADGDFGSETVAAVQNYQKRVGLAQTGDADLTTIMYLQALVTAPPTSAPKQQVKVSGGQAYIRIGPGANYKELGVAGNGSTWEFSGQLADGWVGVKHNDRDAWISSKYAEVM